MRRGGIRASVLGIRQTREREGERERDRAGSYASSLDSLRGLILPSAVRRIITPRDDLQNTRYNNRTIIFEGGVASGIRDSDGEASFGGIYIYIYINCVFRVTVTA